jgi:hypothetical protein
MLEWFEKQNKNKEDSTRSTSVYQGGVIKAPDYSTKASR